jgi:hypothetical protein
MPRVYALRARARAGGGGGMMSLVRKARVAGSLSLAMAAICPPARAQTDVLQYEPAEADRAMAQFSRCIVESRSRRAQAERFVRLIPGQPAFQAAGLALVTDRCVPRAIGQVRMRFRHNLFRSSLFAELYRRDFGRTAPPDVRALPPLLLSEEFDGDVSTIAGPLRFMRALGDCAARFDAPRVHALLSAEVGSRGEAGALSGAMPALANCLPEGRELRFSRGVLRGILAEALYKLRKAFIAHPPVALPDANQQGAPR